ncbi:hypothetical protein GGF32_004916 [Allomyces javanicus]|nr:hypothetical protein GGF32_004916 [Allomyces javanicus]
MRGQAKGRLRALGTLNDDHRPVLIASFCCGNIKLKPDYLLDDSSDYSIIFIDMTGGSTKNVPRPAMLMDKLQKTLNNGGGGGATPVRLGGAKTPKGMATRGPIDPTTVGFSHASTPKLLTSQPDAMSVPVPMPESDQGTDGLNNENDSAWCKFIVGARHSRLLTAATWGQAAKKAGNDCRHIVMVQRMYVDREPIGAAAKSSWRLVEVHVMLRHEDEGNAVEVEADRESQERHPKSRPATLWVVDPPAADARVETGVVVTDNMVKQTQTQVQPQPQVQFEPENSAKKAPRPGTDAVEADALKADMGEIMKLNGVTTEALTKTTDGLKADDAPTAASIPATESDVVVDLQAQSMPSAQAVLPNMPAHQAEPPMPVTVVTPDQFQQIVAAASAAASAPRRPRRANADTGFDAATVTAAEVVEAKPTVVASVATQVAPSPALAATRRMLKRKREDNADQISMLPPILNNRRVLAVKKRLVVAKLPSHEGVLGLRQAPRDFLVLKTILEYCRDASGAAAENGDERVGR